jgi:NADH:ubiquinone oxidoreductase subunit F (NADH-binding)
MNYRREIDTLTKVLFQFAACDVEPCRCCSICREGVSNGGYTLSEARKELRELSARSAR